MLLPTGYEATEEEWNELAEALRCAAQAELVSTDDYHAMLGVWCRGWHLFTDAGLRRQYVLHARHAQVLSVQADAEKRAEIVNTQIRELAPDPGPIPNRVSP